MTYSVLKVPLNPNQPTNQPVGAMLKQVVEICNIFARDSHNKWCTGVFLVMSTVNSFFFVTIQIGMKFRQKRQLVSSVEL